MTRVTQATGVILVVVGLAAYALTGAESPTALLPAILGAIIAGLGFLAAKEHLHRHAIHGALVVALLGLLGTLMRVGDLPTLLTGGDVERPAAVIASTVTALVCAVYVGLGVRSFVAARKARETTGA